MKSASVPLPLAEHIVKTMREEECFHHEGWTQRVTAGWYIVRQSSRYKLLHGRVSIGNIEDVRILRIGTVHLLIVLASGLEMLFPTREPRRPEE